MLAPASGAGAAHEQGAHGTRAVRASAKAPRLRTNATYRVHNRVAAAARVQRVARAPARPLRDYSWWMRRLDAPEPEQAIEPGPTLVLRSGDSVPFDAVAFAGDRVAVLTSSHRKDFDAGQVAAVFLHTQTPPVSLPPARDGLRPAALRLRDGQTLVGWLATEQPGDGLVVHVHPILGARRVARADVAEILFDAGAPLPPGDAGGAGGAFDRVILTNLDELRGDAYLETHSVLVDTGAAALGAPMDRVLAVRFASDPDRDAPISDPAAMLHLADGSVVLARDLQSIRTGARRSLRFTADDGRTLRVAHESVAAVAGAGVATRALADGPLRLRETGATRWTAPDDSLTLRGAVRLPDAAGAFADARVTIWVDGAARFFARLSPQSPAAPFALALPAGAEVIVTMQPGRAGAANAVADLSATVVLAQD